MVLKSGFCVLCSLIELVENGFFAAAVIKKQQFGQFVVDCELINQGVQDKEVR